MRVVWISGSLLAALTALAGPAVAARAEVRSADSPAARVHELINAERRQADRPSLAAHPALNQAAQTYARTLAAGPCWGHTCGPVPDLGERAKQAGYSDAASLSENIATGARTPEAALALWLDSAPHRANILEPGYSDLGVGVAESSSQEMHWVVMFGMRPPAPTGAPSPGGSAPAASSGAPATPSVSANSAPRADQRPDFAVSNGWFYTQASGGPGRGFVVADDPGVRFWSEFQRLGGVAGVGYPISRRFLWDGFPSQAFQKMVFQWRDSERRVYAVNVIDLLHERGRDDWLRTVRATPAIADWAADTGKSWDEVLAGHQALLTDAEIRATYFAVSDPVTIYGLPMAPLQDLGNVLVLRAQRGILQKWLVDTAWAKAGQVTVANSGDVAKEAGILPAEALVPHPPP